MMQEAIVFDGPDGGQTAGVAEVLRYSQANRIVRAVLFTVGGLLGGTMCIIIPIVHLVTTWGFPALGIYMAVRAMRREEVIHNAQGECPQCGQPMQLAGGAINDAEWQVCPHCMARLRVRVPQEHSEAST